MTGKVKFIILYEVHKTDEKLLTIYYSILSITSHLSYAPHII